jgi:cell division protein FtsB
MIHKIKAFLQWGIIILALILAISLVKSTLKILGSNEKITQALSEVRELEKENEILEKEFKGVQNVQFIEREARDKLGLAKEGEYVLILPDEDSLRAVAPKMEEKERELPPLNWEKWLKLFL